MTKSIYDPNLRDELLGYTHAMLCKIHKSTNIDFAQLLQITRPSRQCEKMIKNKNRIAQCKHSAIEGSCFCEKHDKDHNDTLQVEYIMINNKEYLYHSLTNRIYSYGADPVLIGTLDASGSIIPV